MILGWWTFGSGGVAAGASPGEAQWARPITAIPGVVLPIRALPIRVLPGSKKDED